MTPDQTNEKLLLDMRQDLGVLRAEVQELWKYLRDFEKDTKVLAQDTTDRIKYFHNAIIVLQDTIAPIEEKIFPGVNEARLQLAQIIEDRANHKPDDTEAD